MRETSPAARWEKTHLQRCLQIILISLRKILDRTSFLRRLQRRTRTLQVAHVLRVRRLAATRMQAGIRARKNDRGVMLTIRRTGVIYHGRMRQWGELAVMLSRMNACVPFGNTGYPFAFAMNADAGRNMNRTASALHLFKTPSADGRGRDRSSAGHRQTRDVSRHQRKRTQKRNK
jgi:hypothetical protein